MQAAARQPHPAEQSRLQQAIGVGQQAPRLHGAGGRAELVVDKIHHPLVLEAVFIQQLDADGVGIFPRGLPRARLAQAGIAQYIGLTHLKIEMNRVFLDDGRQQGPLHIPPYHDIAHVHQAAPDTAGDRRPYLGELQVEPGPRQGGLRL